MAFESAVTLLVRIEKEDAAGRCRAIVRRGRRVARATFEFPLTEAEIEAWRVRPFALLDPPSGAEGTRTLADAGGKLFGAIFQGPTLKLYRESYADAAKREALFRIVLDLRVPEHFPLPWEGLHDSAASRFLSTDLRTVIVRLLDDCDGVPALRGRDPLRVLGVISAPTGWPTLNTSGEGERLTRALNPLIMAGRVTLEWFVRPPDRTMHAALAEQLRAAVANGMPYHLLHFIGHARYNADSHEGELILEEKGGTGLPMSGIELGGALQESGLSLVLLNACEGARVDRLPYRSVAAEMVRRANIPLAVANQTRVRDRTAIAFADAFYTALGAHASVDEAMLQARRAVSQRSVDLPEWVTSVYFTRHADQPARLLPNRAERYRPWVIGIGLLLLMLAVGISTISLMRHFGWAAGIALQVGFLSLVGVMGWLLQNEVRRQRRSLGAVAALATLLVLGWFLWNPTLPAVAPPPGFALTITEPTRPTTEAELVVTPLTVRVEGTVANMPPGHHLWILVRVYDGRTFAVGGEATVTGERFVAPSVIVGPISTLRLNGRPYVLQPVLVDEAGHRDMIEHGLQRWRIFHPDFTLDPPPTLPTVLVLRE